MKFTFDFGDYFFSVSCKGTHIFRWKFIPFHDEKAYPAMLFAWKYFYVFIGWDID